jgi:hypothetical protein
LCNIWCMPSIPVAERWKCLPGRLCIKVNGAGGGDISYSLHAEVLIF